LDKINDVLDAMERVKVLVIGDLMMDQYVWGHVDRISPEAPVPVVKVQGESIDPGGAANVVNNIKSLGGSVFPCGVVGRDSLGRQLVQKLQRKGIDTKGIIADGDRPTTLKTRMMAQKHQILRIDREVSSPVSTTTFRKLIAFIKSAISKIDVVIIEDYGKGVVTRKMIVQVIRMAKKAKKIVAVDPKEKHFEFYKGIDVITPNVYELAQAVHANIYDKRSLIRATKELQKNLKCPIVLVTQGENGLTLFQSRKPPFHVAANAREVFDVSGAGDTVIAVFCLALATGMNPERAAKIANSAGGLVVGKLGVAVASKKELKARIKEMQL